MACVCACVWVGGCVWVWVCVGVCGGCCRPPSTVRVPRMLKQMQRVPHIIARTHMLYTSGKAMPVCSARLQGSVQPHFCAVRTCAGVPLKQHQGLSELDLNSSQFKLANSNLNWTLLPAQPQGGPCARGGGPVAGRLPH